MTYWFPDIFNEMIFWFPDIFNEMTFWFQDIFNSLFRLYLRNFTNISDCNNWIKWRLATSYDLCSTMQHIRLFRNSCHQWTYIQYYFSNNTPFFSDFLYDSFTFFVSFKDFCLPKNIIFTVKFKTLDEVLFPF